MTADVNIQLFVLGQHKNETLDFLEKNKIDPSVYVIQDGVLYTTDLRLKMGLNEIFY